MTYFTLHKLSTEKKLQALKSDSSMSSRSFYLETLDFEIGVKQSRKDRISSTQNSATRQEREDLGGASVKSYLSLTSTAEIDTCFSH